MFPGREAEIAGEVTPRGEPVDVTDEGDESRCSKKADSRDGHESLDNRVISSESIELAARCRGFSSRTRRSPRRRQ